MSPDGPFDPNDYRKRVLAAVERRGGPEVSDPFELYDLPLDDLPDDAVATRVGEVWAFWQRQRDHPKYRALVALLVEQHAARSAELLDGGRRRAAAQRVRAERERRDAERYTLLDAAISRLVERHGGVPADKVAGLVEVGALAGLGADEVTARLRRHRPAARRPGISAGRRRQVRALLDEFGRLTDAEAPSTLLALLGLPPTATPQQITVGAGAWRSRARELPPGRLRAVVDELLVHVAELLEPERSAGGASIDTRRGEGGSSVETGREAVGRYLDAVAEDVTEHLRPHVRAAVLVEDRLVADDHAHLLEVARARGLDERRAAAVLAALAAEAGAEIEGVGPGAGPDVGGRASSGAGASGAGPGGAGGAGGRRGGAGPAAGAEGARRRAGDPLREVRAALRAGRPGAARRLLDGAGVDTPAARALSDEVDAVLAEARRRDGAAQAAEQDRRWVEALGHLEHLARVASDAADAVPARREAARAAVARADAGLAAAQAGPDPARAAALAGVLEGCRDHAGARAALDALPLAPPAWVSAARDVRGDVVVLWAPSPGDGITYRVRRRRPDGTWQVLGRVGDSSIEDGGAPPGVEAPVYAVAALLAGRSSAETRSDDAPAPSVPYRPAGPAARSRPPEPEPAGPRAPALVEAVRSPDGTVVISWAAVPGNQIEYRVRCEQGGRWRVVGRTRGTRLEDGGAPAGALGVYAVSAAGRDGRSPERRTIG